MKVIFKGSIAGGFELDKLVNDDDAKNAVIKHLANGQLAEALQVKDPASVDKSYERVDAGTIFVVIGTSLSGGFTVYGPFDDNEIAS